MNTEKMSIKSPMFKEALDCLDITINKVIMDMVEKNVHESTVALRISLGLHPEEISYPAAEGKVKTDTILKPIVDWKIGSAMKVELKVDGDLPLCNQALQYNADDNMWELYDCSDQISMFD